MENQLELRKLVGSRSPEASRDVREAPPPSLHPLLQLQQQVGNQAVRDLLRSRAIQAKLAISNPDDPEEREADQVADRIMRAHAGARVSAGCTCDDGGDQCEKCQKARSEAPVLRQAATPVAPSHIPRIVSDVLRSPGHPLDSATRAFFEPQFRRDFSDVRIHTGSDAAESARSINALAYAAGNHLVFGDGQFSAGTESGKRLLAHELTHVAGCNGMSGNSEGRNLIERQAMGKDEENEPAAESRPASPSTALAAEREWATQNPQGRVTEDGPDHLILWNFDVDGYELKPEHIAPLDRIAELTKLAFLQQGASLEIDGHASRTGRESENSDISLMRAAATFNRLLYKGVDGERVQRKYFGSSHPLFPNFTPAARACNRRVEINIVRPGAAKTTDAARRMPQPPPRREAAKEEREPAPWTKVVPGAGFAYEFEIPGIPVPVGSFMLHPALKVKIKGELETLAPGKAEWTLNREGLEKAVSVKFAHGISMEGKLKPEGKWEGGFSFDRLPFQPKILATTSAEEPIKFEFSLTPDPKESEFDIGELELDDGAKVKLGVELEGEVGIGLNPVGIAEEAGEAAAEGAGAAELTGVGGVAGALGPVGVAAGVVAVTLVWMGFVVQQVAEAGRRGEETGRRTSMRDGFSRRIAAEAEPDWYEMYLRKFTSDARGDAWQPLYDGWMAADELIQAGGPPNSEILSSIKSSARKHGETVNAYVFRIIGNNQREPAELPHSLRELSE